jgi:hypothetical protein
MTYGRVHDGRLSHSRNGAVVSHSAELVRGLLPFWVERTFTILAGSVCLAWDCDYPCRGRPGAREGDNA